MIASSMDSSTIVAYSHPLPSSRTTATSPHFNITSRPLKPSQSTTIITYKHTNDFFLQPPKSPFKKLFIGTPLGEILKAMSSKSVPEGLKLTECEQGAHPLHTRVGPHSGGPREKKEGDVLQVDAAIHKEQDEHGTMRVLDSRAVFTACACCHSRMQADGA